jgi:hypothetical protein
MQPLAPAGAVTRAIANTVAAQPRKFFIGSNSVSFFQSTERAFVPEPSRCPVCSAKASAASDGPSTAVKRAGMLPTTARHRERPHELATPSRSSRRPRSRLPRVNLSMTIMVARSRIRKVGSGKSVILDIRAIKPGSVVDWLPSLGVRCGANSI